MIVTSRGVVVERILVKAARRNARGELLSLALLPRLDRGGYRDGAQAAAR